MNIIDLVMVFKKEEIAEWVKIKSYLIRSINYHNFRLSVFIAFISIIS